MKRVEQKSSRETEGEEERKREERRGKTNSGIEFDSLNIHGDKVSSKRLNFD